MEKDLIFSIPLMIFGGFVFFHSIRNIYNGIESNKWPKVQGEIFETEVESSFGGLQGVTYIPIVRYRFKYLNTNYTSDNIMVGGIINSGTTIFAKTIVKEHHKNQIVTVSVCPHDPTKSVLCPGISKASYLSILIGVAVFVFGIKFLLRYFGI